MLDRFVILAAECVFAFGMSYAFIMIMLIAGKDPMGWNRIALVGSCMIGITCALLAHKIDNDVFREMAEVFLGIPLSRRTKSQLAEEFGIYL
ncbi:MAG: hypothetical protein WCK26_02265 [Candidatus Saccharibacteria bacterium]